MHPFYVIPLFFFVFCHLPAPPGHKTWPGPSPWPGFTDAGVSTQLSGSCRVLCRLCSGFANTPAKVGTVGSFFMDRSSRIVPHGSFLLDHSSWRSFFMDRSSWIIPHGSFLTHRSSWIIPHGSFLMDHSSWIVPHESFLVSEVTQVFSHFSFIDFRFCSRFQSHSRFSLSF